MSRLLSLSNQNDLASKANDDCCDTTCCGGSKRQQARRTFLQLFGRGISCCAKDIDASLIAIR